MATDEGKEIGRRTTPPARRTSENAPARRDDWGTFWGDPFANIWTGFTRDMDRWFHDTGGGRRHWPWRDRSQTWMPDIETFHRGDQFIVRADLPGMKKEDVTVQLTDDALTIEGERRNEQEEQHEGFCRSERTYGRFYRTVPLPEGAIADSARATFVNGVLEVTMQAAPKEVSRSRRLEIGGNEPAKRESAARTLQE